MVSVIIPVYNGEKFIEKAIKSALNQTYKNIEIIVVDDGSTDKTREIAKKFNVKYIYAENKGPSAARNKGIKFAKGEYIALLDSDDMYLPNKIEKQIKVLKNEHDVDVVYNAVKIIDENDKEINILRSEKNFCSRKDFLAYLLFRQLVVCPGSIMFRKECSEKVKYPENIINAEDYTFSINMAKSFKFKYIDEVLYLYRRHSNNLTNKHELQIKNEINAIKSIGKEEIIKIIENSTFNGKYKKVLLAKIFIKIQMYEDAKLILQSLINEGECDEYILFYLGNCYVKLNNLNEAIKVYIKAIDKNSSSIEVMNNLACIYAMLNKKRESLKLLNEILEINSNYMDAKTNLDKLKHNKTDFKFTERELRKVLTLYK